TGTSEPGRFLPTSGAKNATGTSMKPIGVFYATREGHTGRIAEHVAARLRRQGLEANVRNLHDRGAYINLSEYAAVVLAASVHAGMHESEMVKFVRSHAVQLEQRPTAFLSVSLSEAGAERSTQRRRSMQSLRLMSR